MFPVIDLTGYDSSTAVGPRAHASALKRTAPSSSNTIPNQSHPHKISRQLITPSPSLQPASTIQKHGSSNISLHYKERTQPLERLSSTESEILTDESEIEISDDESVGARAPSAPAFPSISSSTISPLPTVSPTSYQPDAYSAIANPAPAIPIAPNSTSQFATQPLLPCSTEGSSPGGTALEIESASADFDTENAPPVDENFGQWGGAKIRKAKFVATDCREAFDHAITCMTYQPTVESGNLREILLGFRDVLQVSCRHSSTAILHSRWESL